MHTLFGLFPSQSTVMDAFKPLPYLHYFTYFLVPHIVTKLITEDFKTTVLNAHRYMISSSDAGELVHPESDDDTELDGIYRQNLIFFKTWKLPTHQATTGDSGTEAAANALLKLKGEVLVRVFSYRQVLTVF